MERTWNEHGLCRFFVGGNREREVTFAYTARGLCLGQGAAGVSPPFGFLTETGYLCTVFIG